jgi:hypothetical protein
MKDSIHVTELPDTVHKVFKVKANCHACEHDKAVADAKVMSDKFFKFFNSLKPITDQGVDPKHLFVVDSIGITDSSIKEKIMETSMVGKSIPQEKIHFSQMPITENTTISDIPEVKACVTLMLGKMSTLAGRRDLSPFIRTQKHKVLQADYTKLGGRLRATVKLLTALEAHPDYFEVREDLQESTHALAVLVQTLDTKHNLDIAEWCRKHYPLSETEKVEVFEYEEKVLKARAEAEAEAENVETLEALDEILPVAEDADVTVLVVEEETEEAEIDFDV